MATLEAFLQQHYNTSFYERLTISSLTVLIYFRHYYNPKFDEQNKRWQDGIFTLTQEQEKAIRSGYHGGRSEVFQPHKATVYKQCLCCSYDYKTHASGAWARPVSS